MPKSVGDFSRLRILCPIKQTINDTKTGNALEENSQIIREIEMSDWSFICASLTSLGFTK
jgi:hypothetical protein